MGLAKGSGIGKGAVGPQGQQYPGPKGIAKRGAGAASKAGGPKVGRGGGRWGAKREAVAAAAAAAAAAEDVNGDADAHGEALPEEEEKSEGGQGDEMAVDEEVIKQKMLAEAGQEVSSDQEIKRGGRKGPRRDATARGIDEGEAIVGAPAKEGGGGGAGKTNGKESAPPPIVEKKCYSAKGSSRIGTTQTLIPAPGCTPLRPSRIFLVLFCMHPGHRCVLPRNSKTLIFQPFFSKKTLRRSTLA